MPISLNPLKSKTLDEFSKSKKMGRKSQEYY